MPSSSLLTQARFYKKVFFSFIDKQGLLLAGAVAFYVLLSLIPLSALLLIELSALIDTGELVSILQNFLSLALPSHADALISQVHNALEQREVISGFGLLMLFLFSGAGFKALSQALNTMMDIPPSQQSTKQYLIANIISYCYVFIIGIALLALSLGGAVIMGLNNQLNATFTFWAELHLANSLLFVVLFFLQVILLTSFYQLLPSKTIPFKYAVVGGFVASILWSGASQIIAWYYSSLSSVNLIYGTFSTTIILLLTLELAAIILLFGARLITVYENEQQR